MKSRYLGRFYIDYVDSGINEELDTVLINSEDPEDIYDFGLFMRNNDDTSPYHGIMCESNTSAIALKFTSPSCDEVKLWRIW